MTNEEKKAIDGLVELRESMRKKEKAQAEELRKIRENIKSLTRSIDFIAGETEEEKKELDDLLEANFKEEPKKEEETEVVRVLPGVYQVIKKGTGEVLRTFSK